MTKEFYEVMENFERNIQKQIFISGEIKREPKEQWAKGYYYTNGNANNFFIMYLSGFNLGKSTYQNQ